MTKLTARNIALFVALLASAAFLVYSLRATRPPEAAAGDESAKQQLSADESPLTIAAAPAEADLARYRTVISRNIFAPYSPPAPKPDSSALPPLGKVPTPKPLEPPKPPAPKVDVAGWSYVGYMTINGVQYGLLESESTRSWQQLKEGESFQGGKVEKIDATEIRFASGSTHVSISRSERFPVLPLGSSASAKTPGGQPSSGPPGRPQR